MWRTLMIPMFVFAMSCAGGDDEAADLGEFAEIVASVDTDVPCTEMFSLGSEVPADIADHVCLNDGDQVSFVGAASYEYDDCTVVSNDYGAWLESDRVVVAVAPEGGWSFDDIESLC